MSNLRRGQAPLSEPINIRSKRESLRGRQATDDEVADGGSFLDVFERQRAAEATDTPQGHSPAGAAGSRGIGGRWVVAVAVVLGLALAGGVLLRREAADPSILVGPSSKPRADAGSPPSGLPAKGSLVESRVTGSGEVVVRQWIRSPTPLSSLVVQAPTLANGSRLARVGDITAVADGNEASGVRDAANSSVQFVFGVPVRLVRLEYTLTGAVQRSRSVPGRALVTASFLRVDYSPRLGPTVLRVKAPEVLGLSCGNRQELLTTQRPCGSPVAGGWQVTLRDGQRQEQVMAQVDLG